MSNEPKPSDDRNGHFLDKQWCCKVCDGEIPDGHSNDCYIWKLEKKHRDFLAGEYNAVLTERDTLRAYVTELERERDEARAEYLAKHHEFVDYKWGDTGKPPGAESVIADLRAEVAEAKRDAERYRWLRYSPIKVGVPAIHMRVFDGYHCALTDDEADAAIDAALKDTP